MKLTIRAKLLIGFTILLALSSLIQAFTFSITRSYISSQIGNFQLLEAKKGASDIQDFFENLNFTALGLANVYKDEIKNSSNSAQNTLPAIANYTIRNSGLIEKITFLSPAGKELTKFDLNGQANASQLSYEIPTAPFKVAASGKTTISKVYYLEQSSGPHLDIFSPIFITKTSTLSILKIQVNLEKLRTTLSKIKLGANGFVYILDDEGRLIAHPSQELLTQRPDLLSRKIILKTLHDQPVSPEDEIYTNEKNIQVAAKAVKIPGINWAVVFEEPVSEAYQFLFFIRNLFIVALIGSLIVLLILSILLSENLTSSIRKLQKSTQLLEKGQLDSNINIKSGDEIESLANSFNSMAQQLLQRENSLKREKQETETILQALTDAVIAIDENKQILLFNKAAEKLTGLQNQAATNKDVDTILHFFENEEVIPFDQYKEQTPQTINKLKEKGMHMTNNSGEKMTVTLTVSPISFENETKNGWIITFHDITKEQELEEMKVDFVSMAAHELRTPLTSIRGYASLLNMQNAKNLDSNGKELVSRLIMSSENLANLIDNLLNVSKIEKNTFSIEAKPTDLTDTIQSVIESMKEQAYTQNQRLELLIPEKLPTVIADQFRIGQVLLNIIGNAINYTPAGGSIVVSAERKANYLQIAVADNGTGIPKEALPKLFSKFFRVSASLAQGSKGTGLGLFISQAIVQMHGGKIWADSELGRGSTFTFIIPIATQEQIDNYKKTPPKTDLTPSAVPGIIKK